MNSIPKDPYADDLLLNVKVLPSGLRIKRDAYADGLLNYVHNDQYDLQFPTDQQASDTDEPDKGEKGEKLVFK